MQYIAILFRGWEVVRLNYALEGDTVIMRRKRTWAALEQQRVELASLSGEVRRIKARQPAFLYSTIGLVIVLLILAIDAFYHGAASAGGLRISWTLWGPLLVVGGFLWMVRFKTRKPAEWSHFVGAAKGSGLFVLRDPKNPQGQEKFVAELRKRLPEAASAA